MEGLNVAMHEARNAGFFSGVILPNNGPTVSHFLFADDALFMGSWSLTNLSNLMRILRCFHLAFGLKVNLSKTVLYASGVNQELITWAASKFHCNIGAFPFKYLGIPVGTSMSKSSAWQPLGTYLFSLYKAPEAVLAKLEGIRRNFFWGGSSNSNKISWVAWNDMLANKNRGGLDIGSLKALNFALIKWWWRLKVDPLSFWSRVIHSFHGFRRSQPVDPLDTKKRGVWYSIANISTSLQAVCIDIRSLLVSCPAQDQSGLHATWSWKLTSSGVFTVCSLRKLIDDSTLIPSTRPSTNWLSSVPSKVNIMVWRLGLHRLPTKKNLVKRNIPVNDPSCVFCGFGEECDTHLFLLCPLASLLLKEIINWWNLGSSCPDSISNLLLWSSTLGFKGKLSQAFNSVIYAFCWIIWEYRNNKLFNSKSLSFVSIYNRLRSLSFFWLNARGKLERKLDWLNWCLNPKLESIL